MDNLLYLAILIIFSIVSNVLNKKNKEKEAKRPTTTPDEPSLEDEIRRMAERMMGKQETPTPAPKPVEPEPVKYKTLAEERNEKSPYDSYEDDVDYDEDLEPIETTAPRKVIDYSQRDIENLRDYNEKLKQQKYTPQVTNYEQKSIDSLKAGHELHSVMEHTATPTNVVEDTIDERFDFEDFDARKAVLYAEILKRPQY